MLDLDGLTVETLLKRRTGKWSTYPSDVLAAWVAEMDFAAAEPIRAVLGKMVADSDFGYPTLTPKPLRTVQELFAERMERRFGWQLDPGLVEALTDVMQGVCVMLHVLCRGGDGVVVQPPVYPPFLKAVDDTGCRLVANELVQDASGAYGIDFDKLRTAIDDTTRVVLLCSPHNPTGRVWRRDELETLAAIADENDLVVISDEIHAEITYPGHSHIPIAALAPEIAARTVTLTSATKAFSIPGLRFAVAAFGDNAMRQRFRQFPAKLRGGVSSLGLQATLAAWREGDPWLAEVVAYLDRNRRLVEDFCREALPEGRCPVPEATYLAWLDCRSAGLSLDPYEFFLREARVALGDGAAFGMGGQGFVRLNFATSNGILAEILSRMATAIQRRDPNDTSRLI